MGVGGGLGPESGTGRGEGEGVWVCVGVCVCVCVPVPPPLTEEQPDHRPRAPPPRTRRAFGAARWNTYAARRREAPSRTALAPTSRPSTSAESECTHRSASSRDGASAGSPVNASDAWACRPGHRAPDALGRCLQGGGINQAPRAIASGFGARCAEDRHSEIPDVSGARCARLLPAVSAGG
jgi:hypothetical protein